MHNWFECKVSYEKMLENGMQKKVTEPYLVDALSFTEAEARIIEEIRPFITGEFTVTDIKRARLSELFFNENGDRFGNGNPVDGCIPIRCEQYSRREEKWRGTDSGAKTTS